MGPPFDEETSAKILRQVEFYFSDSNLPRDKFLRKCLEENEDGMVSLPLICSFSRMRSHLGLKDSGPDKVPAETTASVAETLRKSSSLRVSDDGQKVGRIISLLKPEEVQAAVDARSIAAGPLRWTVTMEEVEAFFSQHAKVNSVRLPRHANGKIFCGLALVELSSEDDAKKALELKLTYDGTELEIKPKSLFDEETEKNKPQFDSPPHHQGPGQRPNFNHRSGRDDADQEYPKGLIVAFSLQKVATDGKSVAENNEKAATTDSTEAVEVDEENQMEVDEENQISREDIRNVLKKFGNVKYVDYTRGRTTGYVRFENPESAPKARTAAVLAEEGGLAVKDHVATLEAVEGEAEKEYWAKLRGAQDKIRGAESKWSGGRGSRQRGRGGRFGGRSRQQHDDNEPKPENERKQQGKHKRFEEDVEDEAEHPSKVVVTQ